MGQRLTNRLLAGPFLGLGRGLVQRFCLAVATIAVLPLALPALAQTGLPPGMSFVAQADDGAWALYRVDAQRAVVKVPTALEPRQACITPDGSHAVYAAADGTLRRVTGGTETVLARSDARRAFTQPCLSADGQDVVAVEMADGKSLETEILRWRGDSAEPVRIARQPGAQHDPFLYRGRWLAYASVGCSDGCEELLVEIWVRDLVAGRARQVSLLNALSQAPVTDGQRVLFSSNSGGSHQLWQVGTDGTGPRRLTQGPAQSLHPALCGGLVHLVRVGPGGAVLARLDGDGRLTEQPVAGLKNFRALRCVD
jgi:hypothetical protein